MPKRRSAPYSTRLRGFKAVIGEFRSGGEIPTFDYDAEDNRLWHYLMTRLLPLHRRRACRPFIDATEVLLTAHDVVRVPQPAEIARRVRGLTGFQLEPVAELIATAPVFAALSALRFTFIPFLRDPARPRFSKVPDYPHELQHAIHLCLRELAELYALFGRVGFRYIMDPARLKLLGQLFFHALEVGLVIEHGERKAIGAALLSSIEELSTFEKTQIEPFDPVVMQSRTIDDTKPQEVLFAAPSFDEFIAILTAHLNAF